MDCKGSIFDFGLARPDRTCWQLAEDSAEFCPHDACFGFQLWEQMDKQIASIFKVPSPSQLRLVEFP